MYQAYGFLYSLLAYMNTNRNYLKYCINAIKLKAIKLNAIIIHTPQQRTLRMLTRVIVIYCQMGNGYYSYQIDSGLPIRQGL